MFQYWSGCGLMDTDKAKLCVEVNREDAVRSFLVHLAAYVVVNIVLVIVNLVYTPGKIWFIYPILGWGIGLAAHYICGVKYFEKCMSQAG